MQVSDRPGGSYWLPGPPPLATLVLTVMFWSVAPFGFLSYC